MPYCIECGRYFDKKCICHKSIEIKKYDIVALYITFFLVPAVFLVYPFTKAESFISFLFYGNIVLSSTILLYSCLYFLFKKPYLSLLFGCHQKVDRSFVFFGKPFVLCSRCTGIYVGIFLSLIFTPDFKWWFLLFGLPLIIDGLIQYKSNYHSNNIKRFITGVMFAPLVIVLYSGFFFLMTKFSFFIYSIIT